MSEFHYATLVRNVNGGLDVVLEAVAPRTLITLDLPAEAGVGVVPARLTTDEIAHAANRVGKLVGDQVSRGILTALAIGAVKTEGDL